MLHGLPASRRKSNALTATNVTSACRRRASTDRPTSSPTPPKQSKLSQETAVANKQPPPPPHAAAATNPPEAPPSRRVFPPPARTQHKQRKPAGMSSLIAPLGQVKPCSQEDLMVPQSLELLKTLNTKEYVRLWSSPTRYVVKEEAKALEGGAAAAAQRQQSPAEMSECSSDISSSASVVKEAAPMVPPAAPATPGPRTKPWSLNTKNLKVIWRELQNDM